MFIILGDIENPLNALLYYYKVWFYYSVIVINKVIYVDDGIEKLIGTYTGYPIVEAVNELIEIVGLINEVSSALITVIVIGNIFLKYVFTSD